MLHCSSSPSRNSLSTSSVAYPSYQSTTMNDHPLMQRRQRHEHEHEHEPAEHSATITTMPGTIHHPSGGCDDRQNQQGSTTSSLANDDSDIQEVDVDVENGLVDDYSFRVIHDDYYDVNIPPVISEVDNQDDDDDDSCKGSDDENSLSGNESSNSVAGAGGASSDLPFANDKRSSFFDKCDKATNNSQPSWDAKNLNRRSSTSSSTKSSTANIPHYDWKTYAPSPSNVVQFLRWTMVGGSRFTQEQSDEELHASLAGLARCLYYLRTYLQEYGMPERGGARDQDHVLKEIIRDLYGGGCPLWALEPVMQKAAEGLTGQPNVNWQLFPRKALIYNPASGTTNMFKMDRGFNIAKMSAMEGIAVRLASFASNVAGVSNIPSRFPNPQEFQTAAQAESVKNRYNHNRPSTIKNPYILERGKMARKILNLASRQQGLFYYVNSREYMGGHDKPPPIVDSSVSNHNKTLKERNNNNNNKRSLLQQQKQTQPTPATAVIAMNHGVEDFWIVSDEERELFSRLACIEALKAIDTIDKRATDRTRKTIYTPLNMMICRAVAAGGACAFWFGGSWQDMIVAGFLSIVVAVIGTSSLLNKQERLVYEVIASFVVGLTSGLLALTWPDQMCFSAMAISGVIDLLQGFRVVFAIIEIMSKHTVCGGADLLEGILFTGLISYFLQFGSFVAASFLGNAEATEFTKCSNGINELWYIPLVPAAIFCWSFMFTPNPRDLPGMAFHGLIGYCTNFGLNKAGLTNDLNYFISASAVSLSAGIYSRFTGRQAVGNTVTGLYTLLPGAYLVSSVYTGNLNSTFFTDILKMAVILGIGGWTGTILCSPTLLGTTRGLMWQQQSTSVSGLRHSKSNDRNRRPQPPPIHHVRRQSLPVDLENGTAYLGNPHLQFRGGVGSPAGDTSTGTGGGHPAGHLRHVSMSADGGNHQRVASLGMVGGHHRRYPSKASTDSNSQHRGRHNRLESNVSVFDFDHPTSTMLFF